MTTLNFVITHLDHFVGEDVIKVKVRGEEAVGERKPLRTLDAFNEYLSEATGIYAIYHSGSYRNEDTISINHYRRRFGLQTDSDRDGVDVPTRFILPQSIRQKLSTSDHRYVENRVLNAAKKFNCILGRFNLEKHLMYCHNSGDISALLCHFEHEFVAYLKTSLSFFPYSMIRGRAQTLTPILERYCRKAEALTNQFDFKSLQNPRSPAFVLERYMSFLLVSSEVTLHETFVHTPDYG